ncbi:MAG: CRISPR-associated endonuclease Cas2 [Candidatus Yanofskybacteria bacterium RIFCSPHIGHO2_01_FULL_41_21]|uniref:CRISPR-associated endonuclease Cas2 n=1 Tax=Candidatus Yanofskybacteria bacterium RIFCSPHIGHO2_01_FULL_41_21 TaxID=1802660 RepID=A0A1F8EC96_9BACT|nr:MAG: CRISPR-associated endonuclease Cas2 [Candidatus Yanofskybacteria bacterium RIFCSPHIGHO2_01_FULL_41_21]
MEKSFVEKFLENIVGITGGLFNVWVNTSYKGFRPGGSRSRSYYYGFKNLERRGLIKNFNNDHFIFTQAGKKWADKSLKKYFLTKYRGLWDKKWRIIIFDIPQDMHQARIKLRKKLQSIGCVMLQKSVFVFPYECHEEIGDICESLEIGDYVDILIAESAGSREQELRKIFGL